MSYRVDEVELAQSMVYSSSDAELVLVSNRDVLVKVNLVADKASGDMPTGKLLVLGSAGELLRELPLTAPTEAVPTAASTNSSFADSFSVTVPAELVQSGLQLKPQFQPTAAAEAVVTPRVGGGRRFTQVSVPIRIGQTVAVPPANSAEQLKVAMPVSEFTQSDHAVYQSQQVAAMPTTADEWKTAYSSLLNEINQLRTMEGADTNSYYYGWVPKDTLGQTGLGFVPGRAAVGIAYAQNQRISLTTMLHEVGHNMSLPHAPCGAPANPDPAYPYANAALGAGSRYIWGYNVLKNAFIDATSVNEHDVMSYCSAQWFSDYNYRRIQVYLTPGDAYAVQANDGTGAAQAGFASAGLSQELLLVSGAITGNKVTLDPVKSFEGARGEPDSGPYRLRVTTAQGQALEYPFTAQQIDHESGTALFALAIPAPGSIAVLEIVLNGQVLIRRSAPAAVAAAGPTAGVQEGAAAVLTISETGGRLRVSWDASRYPFLSVTHVGAKRTAIALDAKGGRLDLDLQGIQRGGQFEFSLSDGVNTMRERRAR